MSSSIESEESINDIGSDAEMSTYSSGSELNMDLLIRDDGARIYNQSRNGKSMYLYFLSQLNAFVLIVFVS